MSKVSILTPCYNGEAYIGRFIESILNQTYKDIQLIIVNDGSTDNTEEVIKLYIDRIQKSGIKFKYIYQDNGGQAAAINHGLKYVEGEYLCWIDSDDTITKDSVERKLNFLINNTDYGFVRSLGEIYDENNLEDSIGVLGEDENDEEEIFEGLINETVGCTPGRYMLRMRNFIESNAGIDIYNSRAGQNWQILLPIAYKYKCGVIKESLFSYIVRYDSHSHADEDISLEVSIQKMKNHKDILEKVTKKIFKNDFLKYEKYYKIIDRKYSVKEFYLAINYKDFSKINEMYKILKSKKMLNPKIMLKYIMSYRLLFK
ncbi:MAG: glycosyltransferase family A protein, partial [Clostridium sp.]